MCKRLHVLAFFYIIFYKLQAIFPNQLNYSDIVMKDGIPCNSNKISISYIRYTVFKVRKILKEVHR